MLPVSFSKQMAAASATAVALAQTIGAGGGNVVLNGGAVVNSVAVLDTQRRVIITSAGNDTAVTFTVYGFNDSGQAITDSFAGANTGVAVSNLDFKSVTRVQASAATFSITIGTNTTGSSPWSMPSYHVGAFYLEIDVLISGSVTYSIERTHDDFFTPPNQILNPWTQHGPPRPLATTVTAATASGSLGLNVPCRGWRVTITAGTGLLQCTAIQSGISDY